MNTATTCTIQSNISKVRSRIDSAEQHYQRPPQSVELMAVSKTRPAAAVRQAAASGIQHIGENYLQEALTKIEQLQDLSLTWHFIGPIQSNKTRPIAEHFDWVHSVDRLKIARRLSEQRATTLPALNICLQLNISEEPSKSGFTLAELPAAAAEIAALPNVTLRGLMAIPNACDDIEQQRSAFAAVRQALSDLQQQLPAQASQFDCLSMGMSGDLEAAIAEGATMVRIGTDIFGPRQKNND